MLITLTTDFGIQDGYVGTMKGVMARIAPGVSFVDITHTVPPQDVRSTAYILWTVLPYFSRESVHLVVVDPGVGTMRRPIAAQTGWGMLVGPDNGVFSFVWESTPPELIVELANPEYRLPVVSRTFHGRDVFSPAAAYLARGVSLSEMGPQVVDPIRLTSAKMRVAANRIQGQVLYIDHFGNIITSIGRLLWRGDTLCLQPVLANPEIEEMYFPATAARVSVAGRDIGPIRHTYGEVPVGTPLALVGSEGMLELAVNQRHGAQVLKIMLGDSVDIVLS
ncbi:MAG: SAM-dependent chlorinase/fluorinase [Anaerolineae bacterium]|nr:SAM-dependent chlorinase/fluorinase [Anaerolineae bacterium]